ncbi:glycine betaine ABC transporter substrate-binding protein [Alteribacillus sp. YIM 98480]|uniref:glycine betaine ABC transporter substrate-binding protein n=1 Tax=Alteribacillus sp. YIM 98480 TaxID=2606599 RepID=UPI00131D2076|nr:glycine betaine ABC transporter substrate-binding protein [Alteribacillus sp. YIM 98480]
MKQVWKRALVLITAFSLIVSGCGTGGEDADEGGGADASDEPIVISGKKWTEQYILPYILKGFIEDKTDYEVNINEGLGPTQILHTALTDRDIDMYVDYTGTGLLTVLKEELNPGDTPDDVYERVKEGYKDQFDIVWTEPLGFNNTYALAMREKQAEELGVETYSDLVPKSDQIAFGAAPVFYEREDGYDAMVETYGFDFKRTIDIDTNIKYSALQEGEVDAIDAFTTDGRIPRFNLKVLEDDKEFFPPYYACPLVRQETLDAYPDLEETLNELGGTLDEDTMADLNAQVDIDEKSPNDVAMRFLEENGLIGEEEA